MPAPVLPLAPAPSPLPLQSSAKTDDTPIASALENTEEIAKERAPGMKTSSPSRSASRGNAQRHVFGRSSDSMFGAIAAYNEYSRYKEVRVLARGSFGTAVLLRDDRTGDTVVSKQIFSNMINDSTLKAVESEVRPTSLPS